MKSGGPWNLRGLRPEARAAARDAARRSGMSVGEWLNTVIQPLDEEGNEAWWTTDFDREPEDGWWSSSRHGESVRDRDVSWHGRRDREADDRWRQSSSDDDGEPIRRRDAGRYRPDREPRAQRRRSFHYDEPERGRRRDVRSHPGDRSENDEGAARREGRPYRDERRHWGGPYRAEPERANRPRREQHEDEAAARGQADHGGNASIDQAVAEIEARQRALDGEVHREAAFVEPPQPPSSPRPTESSPVREAGSPMEGVGAPAVDLSGLEEQLRQITARIEALRPASELEAAINGLRTDLAEISRSFTEALPQRALESLEIEVKALADRIDHSRQSGVDAAALAGIERGLAEVREALRALTPAENLIGLDETVNALAKKVDAIVAKDDPTALRQLEAAIGALRGIVSHVASNDTLTKVAEDVRSLAAKVDGLAASAVNLPTLSGLESRIDKLAAALTASTEAGHAVPRELERLLSGLIEKLEWVQLTHTDRTALTHLEDRIASLVKRLDASDARLGLLEGVERGLADLLVYIEQLRAAGGAGDGGAQGQSAVSTIEHEVAEIKQTERRTQDSLEDMQGTVEHVVDRLAMIESDMRGDNARVAPAIVPPAPAYPPDEAYPLDQAYPPAEACQPVEQHRPAEVPMSEPSIIADSTPRPSESAPAAPPPVTRAPIDPNLPPNHPLEPGSAAGRPRPPSAADRIAASEAVIGSKPPVIPDPGGGKSDFIAAARRAARAAAAAAPHDKSGGKAGARGPAQSKTLTERIHTIVVAAAVVGIVVGGFHIMSRLFEDGGSGAAPPAQTEPRASSTKPLQGQTAPPTRSEPLQEQTESPHVRMEPPPSLAPAAEALEANPTNPPTSWAPLPSADSAETPEAPPHATSGPTPDADPGQQSLLNNPAAPYTPTNNTLPAGDKARDHGAATEPVAGPPTDITGSLPNASAPHISAPAAGDKLPIAIGGPALRAAALAGDASAAYEVAVRFAEGRVVPANNQEAAHWFEIAAKKGLAPAQFRLGALYEKGLGVKKDLAAARDLYRAAADKGHGKAMHNLAVLYAEGIDGKADYRTAAQWFRKAADRGITDSQFNLAVLYARGVGVEQNFAESYKWFLLAAKEGDQDAAQKGDEVASHLDEQTLAAARLAAQKWTPLPQPADAITVKGAWDAPGRGTSAIKAKSRSARASAPDAAKVN